MSGWDYFGYAGAAVAWTAVLSVPLFYWWHWEYYRCHPQLAGWGKRGKRELKRAYALSVFLFLLTFIGGAFLPTSARNGGTLILMALFSPWFVWNFFFDFNPGELQDDYWAVAKRLREGDDLDTCAWYVGEGAAELVRVRLTAAECRERLPGDVIPRRPGWKVVDGQYKWPFDQRGSTGQLVQGRLVAFATNDIAPADLRDRAIMAYVSAMACIGQALEQEEGVDGLQSLREQLKVRLLRDFPDLHCQFALQLYAAPIQTVSESMWEQRLPR